MISWLKRSITEMMGLRCRDCGEIRFTWVCRDCDRALCEQCRQDGKGYCKRCRGRM